MCNGDPDMSCWDDDFGEDGGDNIDCGATSPFDDTTDPNGEDNILMTLDDGLELRDGSPCIDQGNSEFIPCLLDIALRPRIRPSNLPVDMGAYEYGFKVHFSDLLIADVDDFTWFNTAFIDDGDDDLIGPGDYSDADAALGDVHSKSLNGIAIPEGVKLTFWKYEDFLGSKVLEKEGPAVIFDLYYKGFGSVEKKKKDVWTYLLELEFPSSVR